MVLSLTSILFVGFSLLPLLYFWIRKHRINDYIRLPQLRPDPLWGHLRILNEFIKLGRPHENVDYAFQKLVKEAGTPPVCLIDLRPVRRPIIIINSHEVAEQISKPSKGFKYSVTKSDELSVLKDLIGHHSILTTEGEDWKRLRKRFNPAFAPSHLMTLLPTIVGMTKRYLSILDVLAKTGEVFMLDKLTTALTFDIIGSVVLETDFHAQERIEDAHPLFKEFSDLAGSYADDSVLNVFNPYRAWRKRRLGKHMDTTIKAIITNKFEEFQQPGRQSERSVLELSLQGINYLTPKILQETADSVKTFAFAGHDTTSITLQWAIYELSRYPRAAQLLKQELDEVFGKDSDPDSVCKQMLTRGEEALKRLQYTSAVIKETLRLYPPASSARMAAGGSNWAITMPETGEQVVVDGCILYLNHFLIGRDPKVYGKNADQFSPERWLGDTDTGMEAEFANDAKDGYVKISSNTSDKKISGASWRPFERGPRNCIGQELANIETRVILACTARHYNFTKIGIGALEIGKDGSPILNPETGAFEVANETLYNRRQITSRPIDDLRVTVAKVK